MRAALLLVGLAVTGYGAYGWLTHDGAEAAGAADLPRRAAGHPRLRRRPRRRPGRRGSLVRWVPGAARTPVRAARRVSAAVTVVALPFIVGAGRIADNPSAFPQSYGRGLAVILGRRLDGRGGVDRSQREAEAVTARRAPAACAGCLAAMLAALAFLPGRWYLLMWAAVRGRRATWCAGWTAAPRSSSSCSAVPRCR